MTARRHRTAAVRVALAIAANAAIVALGAHAGRAPAESRAVQQERPGDRAHPAEPYPRAESLIRLGDAMVASGRAMQVSAFRTGDSPATVIAFYDAAFRVRGMVPLSRATDVLGHVSAFDAHHGLQRFATALAAARGETLVLFGTADARRAPRFRDASRDAPYPVPERVGGFLGSAADDGGVHADMGQFTTASTPAAVLAFYRDRLGRQGFQETSAGTDERFAAFADAAGDLVTIAVQPTGADASAVFVARTKRR